MACLDTSFPPDVAGRDGPQLRARAREKPTSLLIASVVLVHGDRLVTRNTKHFAGIPHLVVETY